MVATQYYKSCNTLYLPHNDGSTRTEGALQPPLVNLSLLQLNVFNPISCFPTVHLKMLVQIHCVQVHIFTWLSTAYSHQQSQLCMINITQAQVHCLICMHNSKKSVNVCIPGTQVEVRSIIYCRLIACMYVTHLIAVAVTMVTYCHFYHINY